jgi:hypothetical protein
MIGWVLTVILAGTTIEFQDPKPFTSERECKDEGFRQVRDYQLGNVRAQFECEQIDLPDPEPDPQTQA